LRLGYWVPTYSYSTTCETFDQDTLDAYGGLAGSAVLVLESLEERAEERAKTLEKLKYKFNNPFLEKVFSVIGDVLDDVGVSEYLDLVKVFVPEVPPLEVVITVPYLPDHFSSGALSWT